MDLGNTDLPRRCARRQFLASLPGAAFLGTAGFGKPAGMLVAGTWRTRVTPPLYVPYLTSSGNGTCAPFQGVHDDLWARALVLDDGSRSLAVLAVDSIGYDNALLGERSSWTAMLRQEVARATGMDPSSIMLAATHAHSTPETIGLTEAARDPRVHQWLLQHLRALASTVIGAWRQRRPAHLYFAKTVVEGLSRPRRVPLKDGSLNRRGPLPPPEQWARPVETDNELSILWCTDPEGRPRGVLLNFTAHPVVTMLLPWVSADYCGAACRQVESSLQGATCLFTQGAAGDVNSIHVSTSFEDAERMGNRLAAAALNEMEKTSRPVAVTRLDAHSTMARLEPRPCPAVEELQAQRDRFAPGRFNRLMRLARKVRQDRLAAEVQLLGAGPVRWIGLPGEPFVESGLRLKRAGAAFVVGYANGYLGYLPVRQAYREGGYEVEEGPWSPVAPGSAERLEEAARGLLARAAMG